MEAENDLELAQALAAGDIEALARAYDEYGAHAYSVALRVLADEQLAEDVVFDCFMELWNHYDRYDTRAQSLRSHVIRTARRLSLDRLKGGERGWGMGAELSAGSADPWAQAETAEVGSAVRDGLAALSPEQRQALELACFTGSSYREIAEATHVPAEGVKGTMRLALEKLHSFLQLRGLVHET
jgi:RNA polymerase sigma-70 factor (ECF subfamily)